MRAVPAPRVPKRREGRYGIHVSLHRCPGAPPMGDAAAERRGDAVATQAGESGAESGGALSGLLVETAADPRFITNEKRVEHREALQALLSQRLRCGTADDWFHLLMTRGAPTVGC